jgi:uncharacterized protein (DUF58 family)
VWTRKTAIFVTFGFGSLLCAIIFRDYQLFAVGVIFTAILAIAFFMTSPRLLVERILPETQVFEGDKVVVHLRVSNRSRWWGRLGFMEIYDELPPTMMIVEGSNYSAINLGPGESAELEYTMVCTLRGYYMLGPLKLRKRDFFGIFEDGTTIEERTMLTVYPRIENLHAQKIKLTHRKYRPGPIQLRYVGLGGEFHSVRDYTYEDPYKRINWKVTAKLQKLMVNQYEVEDAQDIIIFVDARENTRVGTPYRNPLEYSIRACASLAQHLMQGTTRIGLVTYGEKIRTLLPYGGEGQLSMILATLTGTYARGNIDFKTVVDAVTPYMPPKSVLFLISTLDDDPTILKTVKELWSKGHRIYIISPSAIDFEREVCGHYPPRYWLLKLERERLLSELEPCTAEIMDWQPENSIAELWRLQLPTALPAPDSGG